MAATAAGEEKQPGRKRLPGNSSPLQQPWKLPGKGSKSELSPDVAKGSSNEDDERFLQPVGSGLGKEGVSPGGGFEPFCLD